MNLHSLPFVYLCSSDVDALVAEIMAKEPLVTRSKAGQVKGLIESEFSMYTVNTVEASPLQTLLNSYI